MSNKIFAVRKNGKMPTEKEFLNFTDIYLGIWEYSSLFFINRHEIEGEQFVDGLETVLYSEHELDDKSLDWEFIDITETYLG
jgi:hypothetical protein